MLFILNGNGVPSVAAMLLVGPDKAAPSCAITSPAAGATASGSVQASATASDNVRVTKVVFFVDGNLKTADYSAPYGFLWDTETLTDGSHTLLAKAYDAAGNVGTSAPATVTVKNAVDTKGPVLAFLSPTAGATIRRNTLVTVRVSASDPSGVASVTLYADGSFLGTDFTAPYEFSWIARGNAAKTLTAYGRDLKGNTSSTSITVRVAK